MNDPAFPAAARAPLRLASWNIQSCLRGLRAVAAQLSELDVDLVALQEVERHTARSACIDQASALAREAGFPHLEFFPAVPRDGGHYGLALLSRFPLRAARTERLPTPPDLEPRILGSAVLEHPLGALSVNVTHLSHRITASRVRAAQAQHIASRLASLKLPRLLLGDFNDIARSPMHRELADYFLDVFAAVGEGPGGTHPLGPLGRVLPPVRIDYCFASTELQPLRARVLRTRASDHHLLVAELSLVGADALAPVAVAN